MRIVFTGATSFTGMWFVKTLFEKGHEVFTPIQREKNAYEGIRKARLNEVEKSSQAVFSLPFGSEAFFDWLKGLEQIDLFCHHAADVTNYKSPDFDVIQALENNTKNLPLLLQILKQKGCTEIILTGSVFEPKEGQGSNHLRAVSPYGLSKGLTTECFKYYCEKEELELKHFVIPNPFGPYEEFRFTSFLAKSWLEGKTPSVTHPSYVRDNVPVTLLAEAYARFIEDHTPKLSPSYFNGSQEEFVRRFQKEMEPRLQVPCEVIIEKQKDFSEPLIRTNLDPITINWNESAFWDNLAKFYNKYYR